MCVVWQSMMILLRICCMMISCNFGFTQTAEFLSLGLRFCREYIGSISCSMFKLFFDMKFEIRWLKDQIILSNCSFSMRLSVPLIIIIEYSIRVANGHDQVNHSFQGYLTPNLMMPKYWKFFSKKLMAYPVFCNLVIFSYWILDSEILSDWFLSYTF